MNLNEVKKHVKFDLIMNLLIYILVAVCFLVSLIFILVTPAHASQQYVTTDVTNYVDGQSSHCLTGGSKTICVAFASNSSWVLSDIPDTDYGYILGLEFAVNATVSANSPSTLQLIGSGFNRNTTYNCWNNQVSCSVQYVSSNQLNINFTTGAVTGLGDFHIDANGNYLTSGNYSISQVKLIQLVGSDNNDIINNQTQNTNDIISNNNSNTESINNSIFSILNEMADRCSNLLDIEKMQVGVITNNSGSITSTNGGSITSRSADTGSITFSPSSRWTGIYYNDYIDISNVDFNYLIKYTTNNDNLLIKISGYDSNKNFVAYRGFYHSGSGFPLCSSSVANVCNAVNVKYVRFSIEMSGNPATNFTLSNLSLITNVNTPFCRFGSYYSKLDGIQGGIDGVASAVSDTTSAINTTNTLQQQQNQYLMDDTNPTVNTNGIDSVLSDVDYNDPLSYLLTLPISLLQKVNTVLSANSCSRVSFGSLYNTELYLPCIDFSSILGSSIWNTIDLIVAVGLLVIIFRKFYNSISNMLTLGKQKEINDKIELPTPMEFLANILGGGKS